MSGATRPRIAIYLHDLEGGGSQIVALRIAQWFIDDGHPVDIVVNQAHGTLKSSLPHGSRLIALYRSCEAWTRLHMLASTLKDADLFTRSLLQSRRQLDRLLYLPSLCRYLRKHRPAWVLGHLWQLGITLATARALAAPATRVGCVFHSAYFTQCQQRLAASKRPKKWRRFLGYCRRVYNQLDYIVTVSRGVSQDLIQIVGVDPQRVRVIYNSFRPGDVHALAARRCPHPWFEVGQPPPILALGRLSQEKGFHTLIDAVAALKSQARLVILGEGPLRASLASKIEHCGISDRVSMPGWTDNPYPYIKRAGIFVLCSRVEGFSLALVEAMACGTAVVAYDCPHGPREILDNGRYGTLVPVDDVCALQAAIDDALSAPPPTSLLIDRAQLFSPQHATRAYLALRDAALSDTPN